MKHFEEILITLGATKAECVKSAPDWDLWKAEYKTPVSTVSGHYLYLKHKCPLKEATPANIQLWAAACQSTKGYEIIVTPASALSENPEQTRMSFRGTKVRTTKQLLLDSYLKDFAWKAVSEEEYFVDPNLQLEDEKSVPDATKFLINWFSNKARSTKNTRLAILTANGGVGKTTVSRILCSKIRAYDSTAIPILIESDQWRHLLQSTVTLDSLWDLALSRRFEHAGRLLANKTALQVLIREGIFVVVFDGFDELCVNPSSMYRPKDVINELLQLLTPDDEIGRARILLTARETFWETVKDEIDPGQVEVFQLRGFDNDQKKQYFENRLQVPAEKDLALRISKQIAGGIYENIPPEDQHHERLSGMPFMLDLIARYVVDCDDVNTNPYKSDPLGGLLEDICRRESRRQTLELDSHNQFNLFEELFREFQDTFTLEDLKLYLNVVCNVTDASVISRFTNHVFLVRTEHGLYEPRYEVLRVYFVARFLAKGLQQLGEKTQRQKVARLLAENFTGKTHVIDWLVQQLRRFDMPSLSSAIRHAIQIISESNEPKVAKESSMALFHTITQLITSQGKRERTEELANFFEVQKVGEGWKFKSVVLTGSIRGFDFRGSTFEKCTLIDVEFKNCIFDAGTFFKGCGFESTLIFSNCDGGNDIEALDCIYSREAEYALDEARRRGTRVEVKRAFAEDALSRALKKFRSEYGFSSIRYRHRRSGFKLGNPFNERIWDALEKKKIIERHEISNVDEGGLNMSDDKELRREIFAFLDNGIAGPRLRDVMNELTK